LLGAGGRSGGQDRAVIDSPDFKRHVSERENERAACDRVGVADRTPTATA
jgi:hypothetical protein